MTDETRQPSASATPPPLPPHLSAPQAPPPRSDRSLEVLAHLSPVLGGALIGLLLRLAFNGKPGSALATMLWIFILLAPFAIGAVTVYLAERVRPRSNTYHIFAPMLSVVLCMLGSMWFALEGMICVIMVMPIFAVFGTMGGVTMGLICRRAGKSKTPTVYSVVALPLVLAALGVGQEQPQRFEYVERSALIQASPQAVWALLLDADRIRSAEVDRAWMYRIGVPTPLAGLTHQTPTGLVREVRMGKGIHFKQMSSDWSPQRYVRWQYKFDEDSVPAGALDDHVRIGGDYFDLRDTVYTLTPRGDATELKIRMEYRVSTGFNWYTVPLAGWLIGDFSDTILEFYRHRAEAAASA
ncbi:hypothetical protein [Pseudomonas sp. CGJS7]|uniref:hypothetical protein n=1 Tax=Pseudomonas sp. CGJS7 TaxID=3109348 RepID=UPI00300892C8